jgi:hypothetical protein
MTLPRNHFLIYRAYARRTHSSVASSGSGRATSPRSRTISNFIKIQLARLPARNEVWRAAVWGMLGGTVAAVTLIEAFARARN